MASKDKNLTPVQQEYKKFEQEREPKRPVLKNCIKAFFVGGFICFIGQLISTFTSHILISLNAQQAIQQSQLSFSSPCY